jgi:heme exporter protein C
MGRVNNKAVFPIWLQAFAVLELAAVAAATILYLPPAEGFASPEWARLIVFHVPCAMLAVIAYIVSTVYAVLCLTRGEVAADIKSAASASLGFLFTVLATATGMVFAKVEWGTAWNWDPRETSILMLMIVYMAYFALRSAIPNAANRARISAAYNILACLVMPFLVFVLPRISPGLHPKRASLSPEYGMALGGAMLGCFLVYVWLFRVSVRAREALLPRRSS